MPHVIPSQGLAGDQSDHVPSDGQTDAKPTLGLSSVRDSVLVGVLRMVVVVVVIGVVFVLVAVIVANAETQ